MKYKRTVLPNGLTIITVPSADAQSVVVDLFVKTGSRSEVAQESGISHFLEHFLFKGTKKYPSSLMITEMIDSIGGEMNANTGREHTQYYIKAHNDHLPMIFEVLTDMLQQPLLDKDELEREKGVIIEELNMYKDSPRYEIDNVVEQLMWPDQPLGRDIIGTKQTIMGLTQKMFLDYLKKHYKTTNIIIGISGKFKQTDVDKMIKRYWAPLEKQPMSKWKRATSTQKRPGLAVRYKVTEQAHMSLAFRGLHVNDKRNAAGSVLSAVLGGGMSSRLFYEIRERRGLAYYIYSSSSNYQDTGAFHVNAGVQIDKAEEAIKVILEELQKIKTIPLEPRELKKAKAYLKGRTTLALEDSQTRLDWFLEQEAFHDKIQQPAQLFAEIDKVTAADVMKLAKFLFSSNKMNLAIIGPYKQDKKFKKLLKI